MRRFSSVPIFLAPILLSGFAVQPSADIAIVNARIFTGVPSTPWVEALHIQGDRISLVGTTADIRARARSSTQIIDAGGRLVIPGINDAHVHPAAIPEHIQLEGPPAMLEDPTWDQVLRRVKTAVPKTPETGWIFGEIGAAVLENPAATRFQLDSITGDRPLMLGAWHGHGVLFNTAALRRLKVSDTESDPLGGTFTRMPDGKTLTGLAHEYANFMLRRRIAMIPGPDEQVRAYQRLAADAASLGITSVQAMMTGYPAAQAVPLLAKAKLQIRVRVIDFPLGAPSAWPGVVPALDSALLDFSGVKYIVDGTPIERLMFMRAPYSDTPAMRGRLNFSEGELQSFLARVASARVQPMFHATGDAAIDTVLKLLEGARIGPQLRPRIEHGDLFEPAHFELSKRLGVVIVQNPSHFMLAPVMRARLGERIKRMMMVKSIVRAGVPFAIGSDGPLNPFLNVMFATINEVNPSEALSVEEALVAYTRGAAFAEMTEERKGAFAPGMLADLAILSQDVFRVPPAELPKTVSLLTVVGGTIVHNKLQLQ
jgi:predicted amidohydrolase YtcJ